MVNDRKIEIIIANHYKLINEPDKKTEDLLKKDLITIKGSRYLLQESRYEVSFSSEEGIGIQDIIDSRSFSQNQIEDLMNYLIKFQGIRNFSKLEFPKQIWVDTDIDGSAVKFQGLSQAEYTLFSDYFEHINSGHKPTRERQQTLSFNP